MTPKRGTAGPPFLTFLTPLFLLTMTDTPHHRQSGTTLLATPIAPVAAAPRLHYRPLDGWLGDVHPVFHGGKWHIYYLQVPLEPLRDGLARVQSAEIVSDDLIHWTQKPIRHDDSARAWWAIANIVAEGKIYSFYNGARGFDLATSSDGKRWTPFADNPAIPYPEVNQEIRDPFVFQEGNLYHLIVAAKKRDVADFRKAGLYLHATSSDLHHWSPLAPLYDPGNIGIPECPDLFKMGDRYYLLGSWGVDRVGQGRYRIAPAVTGPWRLPDGPDTLDSTEVMAPNTAEGNKRRVFFGWTPTYKEGKDHAPYEWGGHLIFPREVYRGAGGELYLRLPPEYLTLRNKTHTPRLDRCQVLSGKVAPVGPGATVSGAVEVPGAWGVCEVETTFTLSDDCPAASVTFRAEPVNATRYQMTVDRAKQQMSLCRAGEPDRPLAVAALRVQANTPVHLRVFLDGEMIEAFVDDRYALAGRIAEAGRKSRIGFAVPGGTCTLSRLSVHTLKAVYTRPLPGAVDLMPPALLGPENRHAVRFARSGANVYAPFDSALNFEGSFTLACRIKITPRTGNFKANLIAKGDGGSGPASGYHYGLNLTQGGGLELYYRTADGSFEGVTSPRGSVSEEGQWMRVAGVVDIPAGEMRLYRDGKCIARKSVLALPRLSRDNVGALRLGCGAGLPHADSFYGLIDEVRVWRGALTDQEIAARVVRPAINPRLDLAVIDWDFDTIEDATGRAISPNRARQHSNLTAALFDGARPSDKP